MTVLLVLAISVAIAEFYINKSQSNKWKEYLFVFSIGILFACFGAIHDQVTVSISPEYYSVGKGLGLDSVRLQASLLGLKTGMYAGLIFGCIFLFLNRNWSFETLYKWIAFIGLSALVFLVLGSICGFISHLMGHSVLPSSVENMKFLVVWGWHIGLYTGATLGLLTLGVKSKLVPNTVT